MLGYNFVPRSLAALSAAALVLAGFPALTFPVLLLLLTVLPALVFSVRVRRRGPVTLAPLTRVLRAQGQAALTDFTGGSFAAANVTLVATQVSLAELAQYTSAQRVYQLGIIGLLVLSQSLQGWTVDPTANSDHRARTALKAHVLLGLVGGVLLAIAGPPLSAVLFGEQLAAPEAVTLMLAVSFALLSCSTGAGLHVLIPRRPPTHGPACHRGGQSARSGERPGVCARVGTDRRCRRTGAESTGGFVDHGADDTQSPERARLRVRGGAPTRRRRACRGPGHPRCP